MQLGELAPAEIDQMLGANVIGRLGCHLDDETYVVPIAYAYDGADLYVHSFEGRKITMMRANPRVCFEVDEATSPVEWRSVIAWGRYEELDGADADDAYDLLMTRCPPPTRDGVFFRIRVEKRTGRFAAP